MGLEGSAYRVEFLFCFLKDTSGERSCPGGRSVSMSVCECGSVCVCVHFNQQGASALQEGRI